MKGAPFRLAFEQAPKWSLRTDPLPLLRFLLREGGGGLYTGYPSGAGRQRKPPWPGGQKNAPGLATLANFLFAPLHLGACSQDKFRSKVSQRHLL